MENRERVYASDIGADALIKNHCDIEVEFEPVKQVLAGMDCHLWSLVVNYNLRGFDHFVTTYPDEWTTEYVNKNYAYLDPTLQWAMFRQGIARWSDVKLPDVLGVMKQALKHGLRYGATVSRKTGKKRTMLFVSKSDREFTDLELEKLLDVSNVFFDAVGSETKLNTQELDTIKLLVEGESISDIAEKLGISQSAVKTRLFSARKKMDAKNNAQLVFKVGESNLL